MNSFKKANELRVVQKPFGLGFAGAIASGKSTIISKLTEHVDATVASYGDFIRQEANQRKLVPSRSVYQAVSDELLSEYTHTELLERVLRRSGWDGTQPLFLDGVRHLEAFRAMRDRLIPNPAFLVFVDLPEDLRLGRIANRDGVSSAEARSYNLHETEKEASSTLKANADLIVDGSRVEAAVSALLHLRTSI